jgi:hypothetical protein
VLLLLIDSVLRFTPLLVIKINFLYEGVCEYNENITLALFLVLGVGHYYWLGDSTN